jgi:hypothetical protein
MDERTCPHGNRRAYLCLECLGLVDVHRERLVIHAMTACLAQPLTAERGIYDFDAQGLAERLIVVIKQELARCLTPPATPFSTV